MAIIHHFDWKTFNTNNNISLCPHQTGDNKISTFCSCSSSWETICIWTRAWAVLLSSRMCSDTRCFWNSVVSSHRASQPVHLHRPANMAQSWISTISESYCWKYFRVLNINWKYFRVLNISWKYFRVLNIYWKYFRVLDICWKYFRVLNIYWKYGRDF